MRPRLNGPFRIFDDQDRDVTPQGLKQRGLLALLLLSPGQRRTRVWLQDKLWSDKSAILASANCRQALSQARKALGSLAPRLKSDRAAIWIDPPVPLADAFAGDHGDLLDDLDIADPEFCDWLRTLRTTMDRPPAFAAQPMVPQAPRPTIAICRIDRSATARGTFILRSLSQRIASGLAQLGALDVSEHDTEDRGVVDGQPAVMAELECLDETDMAFVLLRVIAPSNRRVIWSGRLSIDPRLSVIWSSGEVTRVVQRMVQAMADTVASTAGLTPMAAIQKAIRRMYEFDRASLAKAEDLLRGAMDGDLRAHALIWRSMVRLNATFEFGELDPDALAEAVDFAETAAQLAPDNAAILAMASEVILVGENDLERAGHLARSAFALDDKDPEALAAMGRSLRLQGRKDESHDFAMQARHHAQGLRYSFDWDLMAAVAKIGIGDLKGAYDMAVSGYQKMPYARHSLRYLTALSLLDDRPGDASRYATKLQRLEPDFHMQLLPGQNSPLASFFPAELMDRLRDKLLQTTCPPEEDPLLPS